MSCIYLEVTLAPIRPSWCETHRYTTSCYQQKWNGNTKLWRKTLGPEDSNNWRAFITNSTKSVELFLGLKNSSNGLKPTWYLLLYPCVVCVVWHAFSCHKHAVRMSNWTESVHISLKSPICTCYHARVSRSCQNIKLLTQRPCPWMPECCNTIPESSQIKRLHWLWFISLQFQISLYFSFTLRGPFGQGMGSTHTVYGFFLICSKWYNHLKCMSIFVSASQWC